MAKSKSNPPHPHIDAADAQVARVHEVMPPAQQAMIGAIVHSLWRSIKQSQEEWTLHPAMPEEGEVAMSFAKADAGDENIGTPPTFPIDDRPLLRDVPGLRALLQKDERTASGLIDMAVGIISQAVCAQMQQTVCIGFIADEKGKSKGLAMQLPNVETAEEAGDLMREHCNAIEGQLKQQFPTAGVSK